MATKNKTAQLAVDSPEALAEQKTQALAVRETPLVAEWLAVKKLSSEDHYAQADSILGLAKTMLNQAEAERKELVSPLNGVVKKINEKYKRITAPLEQLEWHIKSQLMVPFLMAKQEAQIKIAEKQAVREEHKGNVQFADDLREKAAEVVVPAQAEGQKLSTVWHARILDMPALLAELSTNATLRGQINGDLEELLTRKLSAIARAAKAESAAPRGVQFFSELAISKGM